MRIEDFTYYKHTREGYVRIDDKPFDTFASGLCRTHYDFDTCNHTMTLIGVESAFESDTTVFIFGTARYMRTQMNLKKNNNL